MDGEKVVVVYQDSTSQLQRTVSRRSAMWTDTNLLGNQTYFYRLLAERDGLSSDGPTAASVVALFSLESELVSVKGLDSSPAEPLSIVSAEWKKYDPETGEIFDYSTINQELVPTVLLKWEGRPNDRRYRIQYRKEEVVENGETIFAEDLVFADASTWLSTNCTSFIHVNENSYLPHSYRLLVQNASGNMNENFEEIRIERAGS